MSLSREEVEHIAKLARLALSDEEKTRFQKQLSAVLDYAAQLEELDTDAISPTATVLPLRSVMRADEAHPFPSREFILSNAPSVVENSFRVPPVLPSELES